MSSDQWLILLFQELRYLFQRFNYLILIIVLDLPPPTGLHLKIHHVTQRYRTVICLFWNQVLLSFQAGQFQTAMADSAALQQQYYPWYQQSQQHYPGYTYPYNYYYPMGPVSTERIQIQCIHSLQHW